MGIQAFLVLVLTASLCPSALANCYFRSSNTVITGNDDWNTCNNNSQAVAGGANLCCYTARDAVCGEDGLCRQSDGLFYVGGCTDSMYRDPVCRSSCTGFEAQYVIWNTSQGLWHCCGDSWCNYNNETVSEETFNAVGAQAWEPLGNETTTSITGSSSTTVLSTSSASSTTIAAATSSIASDARAPDHSGLSDAAAIGIGVGAGVGAIVLLLIGAWLGLRSRKKRLAVRELHSGVISNPVSPMEVFGRYHDGSYEFQASSKPIYGELDGSPQEVEMPCP